MSFHIQPFSPFGLLNRTIDDWFQGGFQELLAGDPTASIPAANITETESSWHIDLAAPGFNKADFEITAQKNQLVIKGQTQTEQHRESDKLLRREFQFSNFVRRFTLPELADLENISATYLDGVLHIELPRKVDSVVNTQRNIPVG
jgi:HSP20 family protein